MTQAQIFDTAAVLKHQRRAAANFGEHDFLHRATAEALADRLLDFSRFFPLALEIGARHGVLSDTLGGRGGIETLVELSPLGAFSHPPVGAFSHRGVIAQNDFLPFAAGTFDLIISNLALHWVNDLPGLLVQANRCLKPDGLFLAVLFGGQTLRELRSVLIAAELDCEGGASARVSPFVDLRDAGGLLQRAGFALPVVDFESVSVSYGSAWDLMRDLRGMGETNAVATRRKTMTRPQTLLRAVECYQERFSDEEGRIMASFDLIYLAGWRPDRSQQQQPLRPGAAAQRLTDLFMQYPSKKV